MRFLLLAVLFAAAISRAPDVRGIWMTDSNADAGLEHAHVIVDPADGKIPHRPEAVAKQKENFANRRKADPEAHCDMPGVPRITYMPYPFQILQLGRYVVINYEYLNLTRYIYMDKTPRPDPDVIDFFMGASDGRWEGATLVQQSALGGGVRVTQTFAVDEAKRLVISTTLDDSRMGKVPPNRRVYDAAGDR